MTAEATAKPIGGGPPKRKLKNFLLQPRFQLKYTMWVVGATVAVAAVLGYFAYDYSKGQSESMTVQLASQPDLDPETANNLEEMAAAQDRKVLTSIVVGIFALAFVLALTGIVVTHRLVGPAFKLKMLMNHVGDGHLEVRGRLRQGDELQDVFLSFERMINSMRALQAEEIEQLDSAIAAVEAGEEGATEKLKALRERMQSELS